MRIILVLALFVSGTFAVIQPVEEPGAPPAPSEESRAPRAGDYLGPVSCSGSSCHGSPHAVQESGILMNEFDTWVHATGVTHVNAWNVLLSSRSRAIARNLGLSATPDRSPECLGCHALYEPGRMGDGVELADGVSCESCHGPASGWIDHHFREGWSREQSLRAGMIDTRDPRARAARCLDCHMGEGTLTVDHTLIAAGHPMLSFEVDNFTNSGRLPTHWREGEHPDRHGAEAWAEGQLESFQRNVSLIASSANRNAWPEFSHLACDSCHHPLSEGEWRQQRSVPVAPGLPHWNGEHWLPVRAILGELDAAAARRLATEVPLLAIDVAKMSRRERVAERATIVGRDLRSVESGVASLHWSDARLRRVMGRLVDEESLVSTSDRRLAEQVIYGLTSLQSERVRLGSDAVDSLLTRRIDDLYQLVDASRHPDELDRARYLVLTREIRTLLTL